LSRSRTLGQGKTRAIPLGLKHGKRDRISIGGFMESHKLLAALVPLALLGNAPRVAAETVPYWVTDTSAYVLVFTGAPNP
jgi:hypothetical protein